MNAVAEIIHETETVDTLASRASKLKSQSIRVMQELGALRSKHDEALSRSEQLRVENSLNPTPNNEKEFVDQRNAVHALASEIASKNELYDSLTSALSETTSDQDSLIKQDLEDKAVRLRGLLDKSYNKELRTFAKALAHYIFIVSARGGFNANVPGIFKFVVKQVRQDYSVPSLVQAAKETYFKKHNLEGLQRKNLTIYSN